MRSYLSLIPISAKTCRKQNRLTLICIILAVFLVTIVFSFAEIMTKGQAESTIRRHGNYHIILNGVSESDGKLIARQSDVTATAWYRAFGEDEEYYTAGERRVVLYGTEKSYVSDIRNFEQEGNFPQGDSEVMLSMDAKEKYGYHTGDSITLNTPSGDFAYTISGFCADDSEYNNDMDGFCAYMNLIAFEGIYTEKENPVLYIQFGEGTNYRKAINSLKKKYSLTDKNIKENTMVLALQGASGNQSINQLYPIAAAVFVLILVAGVLMISSCMNSNIAQRTQFFGMLRCIGASKKQIMRYVRLEALNWCKISIPIGCGLAIAGTWLLTLLLQNVVGGEWADYRFVFSITGILCGVLVGVVTMLFAAHSPAKHAAAVSPAAAVSGNTGSQKKISHATNTRLLKVETALGVSHAVSVKKNLVLMALSFAFTVTLFLTFYAGLDFVTKLLPSERDYNPDIAIVSADNENSIDKNITKEMAKLNGVEKVSGCSFAYNTPAMINGKAGVVDLVSYDDVLFDWCKDSVVSGEMTKISGDTNYVLTVFAKDSRLNTGDKITIGDAELEIACVNSEGVGAGKNPLIICTEETFERITGIKKYSLLNATLTDNAPENVIDKLKKIAGENELADRRNETNEAHASFWVFRIAAYGFLGIIALISVFNIVNSISMSVSARIKQYGSMRAVGMSIRQMTRMITAEAVTYAFCGLVIGYIAGLFLNRLVTVKLIVTHFGGVWKIPFEPMIIVFVIFILSVAAAVHAPAKRIKNMAITETINEL